MKNTCHKYSHAFGLCVDALEFAAKLLNPYWPGGLDYIKINVILFCILLPIIFGSSVVLNIVLAVKLTRLVR